MPKRGKIFTKERMVVGKDVISRNVWMEMRDTALSMQTDTRL